MGTKLPTFGNVFTSSSKIIKINLDELGLNEVAKKKLAILHDKLKATGEYDTSNAIDMGRYVTLLIGAPSIIIKLQKYLYI